jgi:predicted Zn-dependent protease
VRVFLFAAALACAPACLAETSALLDILSTELKRNFSLLKLKSDPAPYYMAFSVTDTEMQMVSASFGALINENQMYSRILDTTMRVGSPKFDNYHLIRGERPQFTTATPLPIEDKAGPIRQRLWSEADRTYKLASQRLANLTTSRELNVANEDTSDDFSREEPVTGVQASGTLQFKADEWAQRARAWSAEFKKYPGVLASTVAVFGQHETKHLVNTEGTSLQHGRGFARIIISANGKASDGMDLATSESFEAEDASGLPAPEVVLAAVRRVGEDLEALLKAPTVEPFVGPAILSGRASGVFFHEIFGHRIEGHRQKDETEGQTFTKSVGTKVLPEFLSVVFDPTRKKLNNIDLNGTYDYDDEGVKSRPVTVVENGVLKTFLMSRSPVKGFDHSNGHGRRQPGAEVVSRQSNLIVESSKRVSEKDLRNMLIAEIKRQNKPYGLYFRDITGGYTTTGRRGLQAFKVIPLVVFRVYADGRPDELVRGVDIVGTPLASFSRILATGDRQAVFNGYCGAESGSVPVSAISPAILVSEIEIEKKQSGKDNPPVLPAPPLSVGLTR